MDLKLRIELDSFAGAMKEMSRRLGQPRVQQQIVDHEVGKIIEKAMSLTERSTFGKIKQEFDAQEWAHFAGKRYNLSWRLPTKLWNSVQASRQFVLQRKLAAIGLAKNSWVTLAAAIGQRLTGGSGLTIATKARVPNHTMRENVSFSRNMNRAGYGIVIKNSYPLLRFANGYYAFRSAVVGRRRFFEMNLAKGVFNDMKQVAAKYPGIKFTP